jgi:hypothetical protein
MTVKEIMKILEKMSPRDEFDILLDGEYIGKIDHIYYDESPYKDHYINIKLDEKEEK